jgi:hypothetical protein
MITPPGGLDIARQGVKRPAFAVGVEPANRARGEGPLDDRRDPPDGRIKPCESSSRLCGEMSRQASNDRKKCSHRPCSIHRRDNTRADSHSVRIRIHRLMREISASRLAETSHNIASALYDQIFASSLTVFAEYINMPPTTMRCFFVRI